MDRGQVRRMTIQRKASGHSERRKKKCQREDPSSNLAFRGSGDETKNKKTKRHSRAVDFMRCRPASQAKALD